MNVGGLDTGFALLDHRGMNVMNKHERESKIELYGNGYEMLMDTLKVIPREIWKFKP